MARILAKAVNCTDLRDGEPCDRCPSCDAIREGRALDVIELDAASNNKVDDMRELRAARLHGRRPTCARKVFIIDEVQRIKEGWDVLLKTLEEPPDGVLFIFCTTDPSQIRPAVVSRLQRFTFRPLAQRRDRGQARAHPRGRGPDRVEPTPSRSSRACASGGMRDAESMLDQVLVSADDPVTAEAVARPPRARRRGLGRRASSMRSSTGDVLAGIAVLDALEAEGRDLVGLRRPGRRAAARAAGRSVGSAQDGPSGTPAAHWRRRAG